MSVLIVVMFVAVATVCPVVRSDESSAETADEQEDMVPDEILNEYIAEELQAISDMAEEQLIEEYGVTMDEYQESMAALGGSTLMLVGDENGNITVEVSETIDRGTSGHWWDGNYFYFGIDSWSWSAIKWWFSDDCINMLVDQMSKGDLDAISIAEKEFNDIVNSIKDIAAQIKDLNNTLETVAENIRTLEAEIAGCSEDTDNYYNAAAGSAEEASRCSDAAVKELEAEEKAVERSADAISELSAEDILSNLPDELLKLANIATATEFIKTLFTKNYEVDSKAEGKFTLSSLFASAVNGDVKGMAKVVADVVEEKGIVFCTKALTHDLEEAKKMLEDAKQELRDDIKDIKKTGEDARNAIKDAKAAGKDAKATEKDLVKDDMKTYEDLKEANNEKDIAQTSKNKAETKYNDLKKTFSEVEEKYKAGNISEAEYNAEKSNFKLAESDYNSKCADLSVKEKKVKSLRLDLEHSTQKVTNERSKILGEKEKVLEGKKTLKANKINSMKSAFNAAKSGVKAAAKATAKAGCKAAICSTGIGAVISIALDIVMALLIKFIEDNMSNQDDIYEDYGVLVKVQVFEQYTVHQTFKIFWRTVTIHFEVTAPCVPRLDGVYKQW